jgi:FAD-dependent oxidoreductase family protein
VIGGGPAGAAAAITAKRAGVGVVILEESPFPCVRPGETLHPGVEPLLDRFRSARFPGTRLRPCVVVADFQATGVRASLEGLERITPGTTYIFVSNHQSIYDTSVVFASLRSPDGHVAKFKALSSLLTERQPYTGEAGDCAERDHGAIGGRPATDGSRVHS